MPHDNSVLSSAIRYSVLSGGKRIRAILVLAAAGALGTNEKHVIPAALSLELIHACSLVHDDLPSMDNDKLRRGKPTVHIKFGEAQAILAGDALCTEAFKIMAEKLNRKYVSESQVIASIIELGRSVGYLGMIGGQSLDLLNEGKILNQKELGNIHKMKTGALIRASVRIGAILSGASHKQFNNLSKFSSHIGLAFQIKDDILDIDGSVKDLGKKPGSDKKKNKATFPLLLGIDKSKDIMEKEKLSALRSLNIFGREADPLRGIVKFIVERKG